MNKTKGLLLTAGLVLATAFTFSCSGDNGGDGNSSSSVVGGGSSSSVGDGNSSSSVGDGGSSSSVVGEASCTVADNTETHFCDTRDGRLYKIVEIGEQVWFAENLNYETDGSVCYNNDPSNCEIYGRLYNWATAITACPSGWHLPSDAEWTTLTDFVGGSSTAGAKLKAKTGWGNGNGTDSYGFSALPGGQIGWPPPSISDGDNFYNAGAIGYWWSATEDGADHAYYRRMDTVPEYVSEGTDGTLLSFSVRCVKD